ncbi:hypothetical protein V1264_007766 [Littorina saxatilis]|uniref:Uncharacterized protein n=1 Tax=Littorina saxatilis TaxID=31220 RepID=A0AAN9G4Y1_9CAEN
MASEYDPRKFEEDFVFLKELKDILIEDLFRIQRAPNDPTFCDSQLRRGYHTETNDGREVRLIFPAGFTKIWNHLQKCERIQEAKTRLPYPEGEEDISSNESEINFVGFIGNKNEETKGDASLLAEVNKLDGKLVDELAEIDGMLAYVSGERVKGGDYGNLVLFRDRGVVQDLLKSSNHGKAVNAVSPRFYKDVRIHSGRLQDGLTSSFFALQKTLFLFFTLPPEDPGRRRVQMWRACREESDVMKVLPPSKSCC